jgi:hypothetical protein
LTPKIKSALVRLRTSVYGPRKYPDAGKTVSAGAKLGLTFAFSDLADLFERRNDPTIERPLQEPISARDLRDAVGHNFGPTAVDYILKKSGVFFPIMDKFLSCRPHILDHLSTNWRGE